MFIAKEICGQETLEIKSGQKLRFFAIFLEQHLGGEPILGDMFPKDIGFVISSTSQ